jgi:hypothetical protein
MRDLRGRAWAVDQLRGHRTFQQRIKACKERAALNAWIGVDKHDWQKPGADGRPLGMDGRPSTSEATECDYRGCHS